MESRTKRRHMIDFLFPVTLFFVFALSALTVILIAAGIYRSTTESSARSFSSRTSLSYISEKLHQNDCAGTVSIGSLDGCEALIIEQTHQDTIYRTYIYAYEDSLRELFSRADMDAKASDGKAILEIQAFSLEQISDQLLKFSCTDQNEQTASMIISLKSKQ